MVRDTEDAHGLKQTMHFCDSSVYTNLPIVYSKSRGKKYTWVGGVFLVLIRN